jgi:hypothetical protein
MIPSYTADGNLPPGIHESDFPEFEERFVYNATRRRLMDGIIDVAHHLKSAGGSFLIVGGSFPTKKPHPNDFDAVWGYEGVDLSKLPKVFFDFALGRRAQKSEFGGEFFPDVLTELDSGMLFTDFLSRDKMTGLTRGVVKLTLNDLP